MTSAPLVYVVEPDARLRALAARVVEREGRARAACFEGIAEARAAARLDSPALILCRWSEEAGDSALSLRPGEGAAEAPYLLIFTESFSPARIAAVSRAGRAELLPLRPFDAEALANRLVLLLWGVEGLRRRAQAQGSDESGAPALPEALRRRLEAA